MISTAAPSKSASTTVRKSRTARTLSTVIALELAAPQAADISDEEHEERAAKADMAKLRQSESSSEHSIAAQPIAAQPMVVFMVVAIAVFALVTTAVAFISLGKFLTKKAMDFAMTQLAGNAPAPDYSVIFM